MIGVGLLPPECAWPELIAKYDRPVPRYTSYPPVPAWKDDPAAAFARITAAAEPTGAMAMYVHVPFCPSLCYYCACNRFITKDIALADRYLDAVERELDGLTQRLGPVRIAALHWGGGTPNSLQHSQVRRLFRAIATRFEVAPDAEVSVEVDPRLTTRGQIALFASLGFNRLSLGVQDFHEPTQAAIHRLQPFEQTASTVEWAREFELGGVTFDLIYGLPLQTRATFAQTVKRALELQPDTVAAYAYAHVPWVNRAQRAYERWLPTRVEKFSMLVDAAGAFVAAGYRHLGIDHFAAAGSELAAAVDRSQLQRSFMGYTPVRARTLIGVGASAISSSPEAYAQNQSDVSGYIEAVANRSLKRRGCLLSDDDLARKRVIEGIMMYGRSLRSAVGHGAGMPFDRYFAASLQALRPLAADGLVSLRPDAVELTALGRFFARNAAACFDAYAAPGARMHASAV